MKRAEMLQRLANETFDVLIAGGGATGLGCAVDAASRGYRTALVEAGDFASGTSSRSTKLVHGGVRYLAQGNIGLVREALHERALLLQNAPNLVHSLAFLTPAYGMLQVPYYLTGLKLYDLLAGRTEGFPHSRFVGRREALERAPWLRTRDLYGAIEYHDGQFDDARLAIALARTAAAHGAAIANYTRLIALHPPKVRDEESGAEFEIRANVVINAAGVFVDAVRRLEDPAAQPLLSVSRGTHVVFGRGVLAGRDAVLVPRTVDGRVAFAIPWHERMLVGTTDIAADEPVADPQPTEAEIKYLLATIRRLVSIRIGPDDITAAFAGLRPLVARGAATATKRLSREHLVEVSRGGLVTIAGGKWTTYRKMAEDTIDAAIESSGMTPAPCVTRDLRLHDDSTGEVRALVAASPGLAVPLHPDFPYIKADAANGFLNEMARTVDDVLARRTRLAFLDKAATETARPVVAELHNVILSGGAR